MFSTILTTIMIAPIIVSLTKPMAETLITEILTKITTTTKTSITIKAIITPIKLTIAKITHIIINNQNNNNRLSATSIRIKTTIETTTTIIKIILILKDKVLRMEINLIIQTIINLKTKEDTKIIKPTKVIVIVTNTTIILSLMPTTIRIT